MLLLVTGWRRIRAVAPLVLSVTFLFGFAVVLFQTLMLHVFDVAAARRVILDWSARTSEGVTYYALFMLLILPIGGLAWWLLRALAAATANPAPTSDSACAPPAKRRAPCGVPRRSVCGWK